MLRQEKKLHPRDFYMRKLMAFQDTEDVKIITGIRRCGKSSLLKLMVQHPARKRRGRQSDRRDEL